MEDETKAEVNAGEFSSQVHEDESTLDSVVKPVVEDLTKTVESLVQNVADHSSSFVAQVETGLENLAPWASLRKSEPVQESSDAVKSAPAEQENADLDEHSRDINTQPFVAVTAEPQASWTNCCGLLEVLRPSDH